MGEHHIVPAAIDEHIAVFPDPTGILVVVEIHEKPARPLSFRY
jgi:hypothetical protein